MYPFLCYIATQFRRHNAEVTRWLRPERQRRIGAAVAYASAVTKGTDAWTDLLSSPRFPLPVNITVRSGKLAHTFKSRIYQNNGENHGNKEKHGGKSSSFPPLYFPTVRIPYPAHFRPTVGSITNTIQRPETCPLLPSVRLRSQVVTFQYHLLMMTATR